MGMEHTQSKSVRDKMAADEAFLTRLRDEFAMAALTGLASRPSSEYEKYARAGRTKLQALAGDAYLIADAMMEARK